MALTINMPAWSSAFALELIPCHGSLSSEGWRRDCFSACAAHFDAWATGETEYGDRSEAYSPYPNSLIAAVPLIPSTVVIDRWEDIQVYGTSRVVNNVVLVRTPGALRDAEGCSSAGWVILRNNDAAGEFSAHLARDEAAARSLFAEAVAELNDADE